MTHNFMSLCYTMSEKNQIHFWLPHIAWWLLHTMWEKWNTQCPSLPLEIISSPIFELHWARCWLHSHPRVIFESQTATIIATRRHRSEREIMAQSFAINIKQSSNLTSNHYDFPVTDLLCVKLCMCRSEAGSARGTWIILMKRDTLHHPQLFHSRASPAQPELWIFFDVYSLFVVV